MHFLMKRLVLTITAVGVLGSQSEAANILISDFSGSGAAFQERPVRSTGGMELNATLSASVIVGAQVRMGYFAGFDGSNDAVLTAALASEDPAILNQALNRFVPMGENFEDNINLGTVTATGLPRITPRTINSVASQGRLAGQVANATVASGAPNSLTSAGVPAGTRIFLLVYNAPSATATELGIFSASTWTMPSDNLISPTLNTVAVDTEAEVYRGFLNASELRLAPIPEPSVAVLALFGFGLGVRRRR
jgi:hypothetical protein